MPKADERNNSGTIEDRKMFSFKDVMKFLVYFVSVISAISAYSYMTGQEPQPVNGIQEIKRDVGVIKDTITDFKVFQESASGHIKNKDIHMPLKDLEDHFITRREYQYIMESYQDIKESLKEIQNKLPK